MSEKRNTLIVDIGGGTTDISLVEICGDVFNILAVKGDNQLGGEDLDTNLVNFCIEKIKIEHGIDIKTSKNDMRRLRSVCESTKRKFSNDPGKPDNKMELDIEIDSLFCSDDVDITITISRKKFVRLNSELFQRAINLVSLCLEEANVTNADIHDIVVVGGSMRIPKLIQMLEEKFEGKIINKTINPDEAIAVGASIRAANKINIYRHHMVVNEITPLSLGLKVKSNDEMSIIIPKNTKIPCNITKKYQLMNKYQTTARLSVYQGEKQMVKDNAFLGEFEISNLTASSEQSQRAVIEVTFSITGNGLFEVIARDIASKRTVSKNFENITLAYDPTKN
jgi:heat shock protein 1/8